MNSTGFNESRSLNQSLNDSVLWDIFNDHLAKTVDHYESASVALVGLYVPVFFLGILGNGSLTVIILTKRQLRNVTNLFLCSLAVADLAVTVICIPVAVGHALYKIWVYGEFMCKVTGFLQGVTVAASVFTITLLSIDRFLAIKHPIIFRRLSTNKVAAKLIIIVWLIAICLMIPLLIVRKTAVVDIIPTEPVYFCGEHWDDDSQRIRYDIALFVLVYIIPGTVICSSYGMIGNELWTEDKDLKRTESETSKGIGKQMMQGRKRVAKMLIALAVLFAVCWLPYYIVSLYLDFHPETNKLLLILPYTIFLGHSNSAFNPILYFYSSPSFRKFLVRMLRCKKQRFKPTRRENMIVRCTRNTATTTTALTRRPFIRILSSSSQSSRSGSLRFSRSSNTSLKSSSNSNRSADHNMTSRDKRFDRKTDCPVIAVIEPTFDDGDVFDKKHKRAIMECTISVPTTINEESSRHNSLIPPDSSRHNSLVPLDSSRHNSLVPQDNSRHNSLIPSGGRSSPCPSIQAITEASESIDSESNEADVPLTDENTYRPPTCCDVDLNDEKESDDSCFNNTDIPLQVLNSNIALLSQAVEV